MRRESIVRCGGDTIFFRWHIFIRFQCGNRPSAHSRRSRREIYWRSPSPRLSRTSFWIRGNVVGIVVINPWPFGWRNVYSLIRRDARRRLIYQLPKSRSSPRFPFGARRNVIPRRDAIQSLYRSDHVLLHLRHYESRRALDISCTLLYELRTMPLMEIYMYSHCGNVAGTKWLDGERTFVQKWNKYVVKWKEKNWKNYFTVV